MREFLEQMSDYQLCGLISRSNFSVTPSSQVDVIDDDG
jgi:hypothetical protein